MPNFYPGQKNYLEMLNGLATREEIGDTLGATQSAAEALASKEAADVARAAADDAATAAAASAGTAADQAVLATDNGAEQVDLAAAQAALAATNGAAQVTLAAAQAALATSNGAAQVTLAAAQAGLATTNGAAQVSLAAGQVTLATTAKTDAQAAKTAAEAAQILSQNASIASAISLAAKDSIALGRASVADGATFWVRPNSTDGLTRYTNYLRISSTTQTFMNNAAIGTEIDSIRGEFISIGRNKISNATFAKDGLGVMELLGLNGGAPTGYSVSKSGADTYPAQAIVNKLCRLTKTTRVLELTHNTTATTKSDYQLYQTVDIPGELWGDTTSTIRFICVIQCEAGLTSPSALGLFLDASGAELSTATFTKLSVDGATGTWFSAAFDAPVNNANARKLRVGIRTQGVVGPVASPKAWIAGIFADFNRTNQLSFDENRDEALIDTLTAVKMEYSRLGKNRLLNAVFEQDTVAATVFSKWFVAYGGTANTQAPGSLVVKKNADLGTLKAIEVVHYKNSTNRSDYQLQQVIDVPADYWGDITTTFKTLYHFTREHAGIIPAFAIQLLDSSDNVLATYTPVSDRFNRSLNVWGVATANITITNGLTRKIRFSARSYSDSEVADFSGARFYFTGIFADFNRPNQTTYDANRDERIKAIADVQAAAAVTGLALAITANTVDITALKATSTQEATWKIGTNSVINPLLNVDPIGFTGIPSGFFAVASGGGGTTPTSSGIVSAKTPFLTNRAFGAAHLYDGTLKTDNQLVLVVDIPEAYWGDTTLKARVIYYANVSDARITCMGAGNFYSAVNADLGTITATKVSTDGTPGTWFQVIHDVTITNASARRLKFNARTQASAAGGTFSGASSMITAFSVGWNRTTQTAFDRNLTYEADMLAKARVDALRIELSGVTPRNLMGSYDQYTDSRGNICPALPTATITCFGDSLTAASYPSKLAALFASAPRTVKNYGIGGETSYMIIDRIEGHAANTTGVAWVNGTIRLKTKRFVPGRTIDELYRLQWGTFGSVLGEPKLVEFFNSTGLIGKSRLQIKALATVSGKTFSATAHPFVVGDEVYHLGASLPSGMYAGKVYYVRDVTANSYSLAEFPSGSAVSFGSGAATALGPFYLDWAYTGQDHTISTVTHTDTDKDTIVLWMGANNIAQMQTVKDDIRDAFNHFKALAKRILIMTVLPNDSYLSSTATGISLSNVNAWILEEYPNNSVDALGYLKSKYNPAIAQDVIDVANNITPSSLRVDTIHLTEAGYQHIADLAFAFFNTRGW